MDLSLSYKKNRNLFYYPILCLLFVPSVTFGVFSAEIFPWVILIVPFLLNKIDKGLFVFLLYLTIYSVFSLALYGHGLFGETIRSLAAYTNALLAFSFAMSCNKKMINRLVVISINIFLFFFILGLLQHNYLITYLEPVIKLFVPRGSSMPLYYSGRGVTLLSIEPARAGNELFFLYLVIRSLYIKRYRVVSDLIMLIYFAIVIKSSMVLMFFMLFLVLSYNIYLLPILVLLTPIILSIDYSSIGGRALDLFIELSKLDGIDEILFVLMKTSGNRLTSIYSSFLFGFTHPFGGGIGNWLNSSKVSLAMTGIDLSQLNFWKMNGLDAGSRSSGFCSNLILDTGVVGLLSLLFYMRRRLKPYWNKKNGSKLIIITLLIKIFFIGAVGHPVAWICTALVIRVLADRHTNINSSHLSLRCQVA